MKKMWLLVFLVFILTGSAFAQNRYWIFFKDKGEYSKLSYAEQQAVVDQYLTEQARERRLKRAMISLNKTSALQDLPVDETYISQVQQMGFNIPAICGINQPGKILDISAGI